MESPDLVIFDCDGVLVDSEPLTARLLSQSVNDLGLSMTEKEVRRTFTGRSWDDVRRKLCDLCGREVPPEWVEGFLKELQTVLEKELKPVEGIFEVINTLADSAIPFCVATNGSIDKMKRSLRITGLLGYFEQSMFSAFMVANPKPAPDLFIYACREMGAVPERTLIIEDSVAGVEAALAANMHVYGYVGDPLSEAGAMDRAGAPLLYKLTDLPIISTQILK